MERCLLRFKERASWLRRHARVRGCVDLLDKGLMAKGTVFGLFAAALRRLGRVRRYMDVRAVATQPLTKRRAILLDVRADFPPPLWAIQE